MGERLAEELGLIKYLVVIRVSHFGCLLRFHGNEASRQRGIIWENILVLSVMCEPSLLFLPAGEYI